MNTFTNAIKKEPTDRDATLQQGRQLVAQRFPATRSHHDEGVSSGQGGVDDLLLVGAPALDFEGVPQQVGHGLGPREIVAGPVALG